MSTYHTDQGDDILLWRYMAKGIGAMKDRAYWRMMGRRGPLKGDEMRPATVEGRHVSRQETL